ncbi:MAG: glycosyltransferase family 2 protein [Flavobacterium sp.]
MNYNDNTLLSVLIITLNEAKQMKPLLADLQFADEVVIVDSYSTDETEEVVKEFPNVRFIQNKFENYTHQRNFAIGQAKNNWILFLDADERLTPSLKEEIIETIQTNNTYVAFLFFRTFMFKNEKLKFSGWQTDKIFRLFHKEFAKYTTERLVHEKLDVQGKIGVFKNPLIHYSYADYQSYKAKMLSYGKLKAQEKFAKKMKPSVVKRIFHPVYSFLYSYTIRLGFLDGKKGITICYLNALSVHERYKELQKLNSQNSLLR